MYKTYFTFLAKVTLSQDNVVRIFFDSATMNERFIQIKKKRSIFWICKMRKNKNLN